VTLGTPSAAHLGEVVVDCRGTRVEVLLLAGEVVRADLACGSAKFRLGEVEEAAVLLDVPQLLELPEREELACVEAETWQCRVGPLANHRILLVPVRKLSP